MTHDAIARRMGRSQGAVKLLQYRAIARVREAVRAAGDAPGAGVSMNPDAKLPVLAGVLRIPVLLTDCSNALRCLYVNTAFDRGCRLSSSQSRANRSWRSSAASPGVDITWPADSVGLPDAERAW